MNSTTSHNYVLGEGGTGIRVLLAMYHILSSRAYSQKGAAENLKLTYETMDGGSEEIEEIRSLLNADKVMNYYDPNYDFVFLKLAERVRDELSNDKEMTIARIASDFLKNKLLLTDEELKRNMMGGYYGDLTLGRYISPVALKCALETAEDKKAGFRAIADDVIAANNNYEVRVVLVFSGFGGEGRTNACLHPSMLKDLCIKRAMDELKMQFEQAKAYVENVLKIGVVMIGSAFRFPVHQSLNQDIAGLVAGTLSNYPDDSADAVNLFYLLEHDCCPVQSDKPSESGAQHKHAHAIELVACAAIEDFFHRDTESVSKKQCPVIPHYSMPGRSLTNWENLGLPKEYRQDITARLRFDAALFYWIRPQLMVSSGERANGKLYKSEILARMFRVKTPAQVKEAIINSGMDIDQEIIEPLGALLTKEKKFLRYLEEVCLTGKNWETGSMPSAVCGTDLFDVSRIEHMLTDAPDINVYGGMTGFKFDEITACPKNTLTGKAEDNLYSTGLTMDRLRSRTVYNNRGSRRTFREFLESVYDICSSRKEKRYGFI